MRPDSARSRTCQRSTWSKARRRAGQLAVFGSEPGEKNYSPLWSKTILTWKAGAPPDRLEERHPDQCSRKERDADRARRTRRSQLSDHQGRVPNKNVSQTKPGWCSGWSPALLLGLEGVPLFQPLRDRARTHRDELREMRMVFEHARDQQRTLGRSHLGDTEGIDYVRGRSSKVSAGLPWADSTPRWGNAARQELCLPSPR